MTSITDQLILALIYLLTVLILLLIVLKLANLPIKTTSVSSDRYNAAFGLYLFFVIVSIVVFYSEVPTFVQTARDLLKTQPGKYSWTQIIKYILIFSGFSLLFWIISFYIASKCVQLVKKGGNLSIEIAANEKSLTLCFGAIVLLISFVLRQPFIEICKYFLPKSSIPFYR